MPRAGIRIKLAAATAMPRTLVSGCSRPAMLRTDSTATYGASTKNWSATSFCARRSAASEWMRPPLKRQMMTTLATPSITESRPKPTRAIEPARIPAPIASAPSVAIQPRLIQDSRRARPTSRVHSALPGGAGA